MDTAKFIWLTGQPIPSMAKMTVSRAFCGICGNIAPQRRLRDLWSEIPPYHPLPFGSSHAEWYKYEAPPERGFEGQMA
jgi:hypothetical protein